MRIERTGEIKPLTPRFETFLKEGLHAVSIDEKQSPEKLRVDYEVFRGLLAIELKTLEEDASERVDNLMKEFRERDDWPVFLGSAPMQTAISKTNDPDGLNRRFLDRVGRSMVNHVKKANKQLAAHVAAYPRQNIVRAMVLINEDHETYDPNFVGYVLMHALSREEGGNLLYPHIDVVIYLTERHAAVLDGQVTFPSVIVESRQIEDAIWKSDVAQHLVAKWAKWNNSPLYVRDFEAQGFEAVDHIPDQMTRQGTWELAYRRQPYLRSYTREQLLDRFDELQIVFALGFTVDTPLQPPAHIQTKNTELFTHMMLELAHRGISIPELPHSAERDVAAARRMNLPPKVVDWLYERHQNSPSPRKPSGSAKGVNE